MNLPRSTRRSTLTWAVNVVTLAVLLSSVWMSAQQRPGAQPKFNGTPTSAESSTRPVAAPGMTAAYKPADATAALAVGSAALDVETVHRVAFSVPVTR